MSKHEPATCRVCAWAAKLSPKVLVDLEYVVSSVKAILHSSSAPTAVVLATEHVPRIVGEETQYEDLDYLADALVQILTAPREVQTVIHRRAGERLSMVGRKERGQQDARPTRVEGVKDPHKAYLPK